jgi:hypothetical protein
MHNPFQRQKVISASELRGVHDEAPFGADAGRAESSVLPTPQPLVADQPIQREQEDCLERGGLVKAIVATVKRAPRSGFVIGLTGQWGDGKSSVLNMVAEQLEIRDIAQVVRFNPWMFSGSDELLQRFFSEFAAEMRLGGRAGKRAAVALSKLGAALSRLGPVPMVGGALEAGGTVAQGAARLLQAGASLHDYRQRVKKALLELDRPVLVIVDDIDRLRSQDEIAEMVRLIRLVGDLPRVTYLMAYEREEVARALGSDDTKRGEAYLEKIVQTVFELPLVRRDLIDNLLTEEMRESIGDLSQRRFDPQRFQALQFAGLRGLFRNMRDIRRFASALSAVVPLLANEVELSDVLALEALRLLEPQVFALIASNSDTLTSRPPDTLLAPRLSAHKPEQAVKQIIEVARRPEIVEDVLKELFPAAQRYLGGMHYSGSFEKEWRAGGRVASQDVLTIYLERGLPQGMISSHRVKEVLAMLDDRQALERLVTETSEAELIRLFGRLEDHAGQLKLAHPAMTIEVLSGAGARLRPSEPRGLRYDGHIAVSRLLLRILRGHDSAEVEEIMREAHWPDLSTRAQLVGMVGYRQAGNHLVSEAAAHNFEHALVEAILAAPAATLAQEPELQRLLGIAEESEPQRTSDRIGEIIFDPLLLVRWLGQGMIEKRGEAGLSYLLPWSELVKQVDSARLVEATHKLDDSWIAEHANQQQQEAVRQARTYAEHPETAADDLRAFTGGAIDDSGESSPPDSDPGLSE